MCSYVLGRFNTLPSIGVPLRYYLCLWRTWFRIYHKAFSCEMMCEIKEAELVPMLKYTPLPYSKHLNTTE
jgi:hypothetical protein